MSYEIDYQDYQKALQFDQRTSGVTALRNLTQVLIDQLDPKETDRVLDVGTGTGRLGTVIHKLVPGGIVIGLDSGYGMLRVANEKILKLQIDNYHIVRAKAEVMPFPSMVFDSAYLMLSFHHFTEPEKAASEINRTLKPEGYLVSLDPVLKDAENEEDQRLNAMIEEAFRLAHGPDFKFLTTSDLRKLWEKTGFSIENCEAYNFPFRHSRIEEVPMGTHWLQVYELLQTRQEEDLLRRYEQNYFAFQMQGRQVFITGKMSWAAIKALKK